MMDDVVSTWQWAYAVEVQTEGHGVFAMQKSVSEGEWERGLLYRACGYGESFPLVREHFVCLILSCLVAFWMFLWSSIRLSSNRVWADGVAW